MKRWGVIGLLVLVGSGIAAVDSRYPWLWAYLADHLRAEPVQAAPGPTHVMFVFVDHFEPHDQRTMDRWMDADPALAARHRDADGRMPQHTWFWYFSYADGAESLAYLQQLAQLAYGGFGEVELHLHHGPDTERTFLEKITRMIRLSQWTGAMVTAEPTPHTTFGFIHGLWSLDNSRGEAACGINNELILLRRLGCYADFTHPSWGTMHPRIVNRLYYATDEPQRAKSYDTGVVMEVGKPATGDLLIVEGPSVVRFRGVRPTYDHGDVTMVELPTPQRLDAWVQAGVHVRGRPEWVFVKVFTHGAVAQDGEAVLGEWRDRLHQDLETRYNDGSRYVLHYVTAREAYNISKAAEAGLTGDPGQYRDFVLPPYANRFLIASVPYELVTMTHERIVVRFLAAPGSRVTARVRGRAVLLSGDAQDITVEPTAEDVGVTFTAIGEGLVEFHLPPRELARSRS